MAHDGKKTMLEYNQTKLIRALKGRTWLISSPFFAIRIHTTLWSLRFTTVHLFVYIPDNIRTRISEREHNFERKQHVVCTNLVVFRENRELASNSSFRYKSHFSVCSRVFLFRSNKILMLIEMRKETKKKDPVGKAHEFSALVFCDAHQRRHTTATLASLLHTCIYYLQQRVSRRTNENKPTVIALRAKRRATVTR